MQKIKYTPLSPVERRKYTQKQILAKIVSILVILLNLASIGFGLFLTHIMMIFNLSRPSDWTLATCLLVKGFIGIKFGAEAFRGGLNGSIFIEEFVTIAVLALVYFGQSIINGIETATSSLMFVPIVFTIVIILAICALSYVLIKNRSKNKKSK